MGFRDAPHNSQPEPRAPAGPGSRRVLPPKARKHRLQGGGLNPGRRVFHGDPSAFLSGRYRKLHRSRRIGVAQGILQKIVEELGDAHRIEGQAPIKALLLQRQRQPGILEAPRMAGLSLFEEGGEVAGLILKRGPA